MSLLICRSDARDNYEVGIPGERFVLIKTKPCANSMYGRSVKNLNTSGLVQEGYLRSA
jgi:hypothetical protein